MKERLDRTKVVLRHLPPAMTEAALVEQIDGRFRGRYNWFSFRPGKNSSQKNQRYSRAYIDFQTADDVVEFAEFFDGHTFVNEKGAQFKALVEYAPSQRVPKVLSKKDGREGTIFKDPEYLEFLELIAKPSENLPSAEIQLERREAERAGGSKEAPIVTPLMDFVRQKRAARSGSQRSSANGKLSRRAGGAASSSSTPSKRGSERRKVPTTVYVLRDNTKGNGGGKDKSTYTLMSRKEEKQLPSAGRAEVSEDETATGSDGTTSIASASVEIGKKKVMLLKGKEREASHASGGLSQQQSSSASVRNLTASPPIRQSQRQEASGRIIRSILSSKDARQFQSHSGATHSAQQSQAVNSERDKRPPRPLNARSFPKDHITSIAPHASGADNDGKRFIDDKTAAEDQNGTSEKHDKRTRNKDRPDRGVWTPLRRSDGVHPGDDTFVPAQLLSNSRIRTSQQVGGVKIGDEEMGFYNGHVGRSINSPAAYEVPLNHGEFKSDLPNLGRNAEIKILGGGRASMSPSENGSLRHAGRRGPVHGVKDADGSLNFSEGKPSKRLGSAGYGSHEKQVWVQKSGSGS